ncbi:MAG TPA: hypothetical protein VNH19_06630, partial [Candidatus Limnocylindrales bacterium]|nr:hypothetical protein [Candidatus Limnocylindrales bacterium]
IQVINGGVAVGHKLRLVFRVNCQIGRRQHALPQNAITRETPRCNLPEFDAGPFFCKFVKLSSLGRCNSPRTMARLTLIGKSSE